MAYKKTFKQSPNFTSAANAQATWGVPRTIEAIAIHWWGDPKFKPSLAGVVAVLTSVGREASAHHVATGTGREVTQLVKHQDASWATNSANPYTISIECDPRARDSDYDVIGELIADIRKEHGDLPLVPHDKFAPTRCPGRFEGGYDLARLDKIARQKAGATTTTSTTVANVTYARIKKKTVVFTRDTPLWDFNFTKWENAKPMKDKDGKDIVFKKGDKLDTVGTAKNGLGGDYYMTQYSFGSAEKTGKPNATGGVNMADVEDYIPEIPTAAEPAADDPTPDSVAGVDRIGSIEDQIRELNDKTDATATLANGNKTLIDSIIEFISSIFSGWKK